LFGDTKEVMLIPNHIYESRCNKYERQREEDKLFIVGDWVKFRSGHISMWSKSNAAYVKETGDMSNVELWEPSPGEMCIFWNDEMKSYRIAEFKEIASNPKRKGMYKDKQSNYFQNIAPLEYAVTIRDKDFCIEG